MKRSTKINLSFTLIAIIISLIAISIDWRQNIRLDKLQYELNSLNFKPVIEVSDVFLTSFRERFDSITFLADKVDSTGLIKMKSEIETDITFNIKNIGNSNAKIVAAFCIDTISGDDKLRELIYREGLTHKYDSSNNEFYSFQQLQPKYKDKLKFHKKIDFVNNETFAIHLLVLYKNDMGILYDSYYWAKFQKKDLLIDFIVDSRNGQIVYSKIVGDMRDYVKFIDENIAYKIYTKEEKENFELLLDDIKQK